MEEVILVDDSDVEIGTMEKMEAHKTGSLHRAFSILVFNSKGEMLIHKRAKSKYHSAGLWTNACCSHPRPGEKTGNATRRRLKEEMGIDTQLIFSHKFIYKKELENDLIEHEYDHVFVGLFDGEPTPDPAEIEDWKFTNVDDLRKEINHSPDDFTHWFKLIMNQPDFYKVLS